MHFSDGIESKILCYNFDNLHPKQQGKQMQLNVETMGNKAIEQLRAIFLKDIKDGTTVDELTIIERTNSIIDVLERLKNGDKELINAFLECKIIEEEVLPIYERKIRSIAIADMKDKILYNNDNKKYWSSTRLSTFLLYTSPDGIDKTREEIARTMYNKHKKVMETRLRRLKTNIKVQELFEAHPTIDIQRAMAYGIVTGKLSNTEDDIIWLDNLIKIIQTPKKA